MLKMFILSPKGAAYHRTAIIRGAILLLAMVLVAQLLQIGGRRIPSLVLEGYLICASLFGLLMSILMAKGENRSSLMILFVTVILASAIQLFWSSGAAICFVVLVAALSIGDALANIVILGSHILRNGRRSR